MYYKIPAIMAAPLAATLLTASFSASADSLGIAPRFATVASAAQEVRGGPDEFSPAGIDSAGVARAVFRIDAGLRRVDVRIVVRRLNGDLTRAHLHCARAGENGPIALGFIDPGPLALIGKTIQGTLDNDDLPATDACLDAIGQPVNNMAALAAAIREGLIYLNIHTTAEAAGEVRGQLVEIGGDKGDDDDD